MPYRRHFCYEDGFKVGCREAGCIPFYSPCCGGAPGRHFPCKHLVGPPTFYSSASSLPPFCADRASQGGVTAVDVPKDYEVEPGDLIQTSGVDGLFPKGHPVGRVAEKRETFPPTCCATVYAAWRER